MLKVCMVIKKTCNIGDSYSNVDLYCDLEYLYYVDSPYFDTVSLDMLLQRACILK